MEGGGSLGHAHMHLCACKESRMYSYTRMCVYANLTYWTLVSFNKRAHKFTNKRTNDTKHTENKHIDRKGRGTDGTNRKRENQAKKTIMVSEVFCGGG